MIGGIIITHGPIAHALIKAAEEIMGTFQFLYGFSSTNLSLVTLNEKMDEIFGSDSWPNDTMIFVSLKGGSCWNCAVTAKNRYRNIEVLSGVNLSMILSFLTKREQFPIIELAAIVRDDGIKGIDYF